MSTPEARPVVTFSLHGNLCHERLQHMLIPNYHKQDCYIIHLSKLLDRSMSMVDKMYLRIVCHSYDKCGGIGHRSLRPVYLFKFRVRNKPSPMGTLFCRKWSICLGFHRTRKRVCLGS